MHPLSQMGSLVLPIAIGNAMFLALALLIYLNWLMFSGSDFLLPVLWALLTALALNQLKLIAIAKFESWSNSERTLADVLMELAALPLDNIYALIRYVWDQWKLEERWLRGVRPMVPFIRRVATVSPLCANVIRRLLLIRDGVGKHPGSKQAVETNRGSVQVPTKAGTGESTPTATSHNEHVPDAAGPLLVPLKSFLNLRQSPVAPESTASEDYVGISASLPIFVGRVADTDGAQPEDGLAWPAAQGHGHTVNTPSQANRADAADFISPFSTDSRITDGPVSAYGSPALGDGLLMHHGHAHGQGDTTPRSPPATHMDADEHNQDNEHEDSASAVSSASGSGSAQSGSGASATPRPHRRPPLAPGQQQTRMRAEPRRGQPHDAVSALSASSRAGVNTNTIAATAIEASPLPKLRSMMSYTPAPVARQQQLPLPRYEQAQSIAWALDDSRAHGVDDLVSHGADGGAADERRDTGAERGKKLTFNTDTYSPGPGTDNARRTMYHTKKGQHQGHVTKAQAASGLSGASGPAKQEPPVPTTGRKRKAKATDQNTASDGNTTATSHNTSPSNTWPQSMSDVFWAALAAGYTIWLAVLYRRALLWLLIVSACGWVIKSVWGPLNTMKQVPGQHSLSCSKRLLWLRNRVQGLATSYQQYIGRRLDRMFGGWPSAVQGLLLRSTAAVVGWVLGLYRGVGRLTISAVRSCIHLLMAVVLILGLLVGGIAGAAFCTNLIVREVAVAVVDTRAVLHSSLQSTVRQTVRGSLQGLAFGQGGQCGNQTDWGLQASLQCTLQSSLVPVLEDIKGQLYAAALKGTRNGTVSHATNASSGAWATGNTSSTGTGWPITVPGAGIQVEVPPALGMAALQWLQGVVGYGNGSAVGADNTSATPSSLRRRLHSLGASSSSSWYGQLLGSAGWLESVNGSDSTFVTTDGQTLQYSSPSGAGGATAAAADQAVLGVSTSALRVDAIVEQVIAAAAGPYPAQAAVAAELFSLYKEAFPHGAFQGGAAGTGDAGGSSGRTGCGSYDLWGILSGSGQQPRDAGATCSQDRPTAQSSEAVCPPQDASQASWPWQAGSRGTCKPAPAGTAGANDQASASTCVPSSSAASAGQAGLSGGGLGLSGLSGANLTASNVLRMAVSIVGHTLPLLGRHNRTGGVVASPAASASPSPSAASATGGAGGFLSGLIGRLPGARFLGAGGDGGTGTIAEPAATAPSSRPNATATGSGAPTGLLGLVTGLVPMVSSALGLQMDSVQKEQTAEYVARIHALFTGALRLVSSDSGSGANGTSPGQGTVTSAAGMASTSGGQGSFWITTAGWAALDGLRPFEAFSTAVDMHAVGEALDVTAVHQWARRSAASLASLARILSRVARVLLTYTASASASVASSIMSVTLFLNLLFYLLASPTDWLTGTLTTLLPDDKATRVQTVLASTVRAVFVVNAKIAAYQAALTYLVLSIAEVHLVATATAMSVILACLPFFPAALVVLPAAVELSLGRGAPLAALLLVIGYQLVASYATWYLQESSSILHPSALGLAILAGAGTFGLHGAVLGPLLMSLLVAVVLLVAEQLNQKTITTNYTPAGNATGPASE